MATKIKQGMTGKQVSEVLDNNFINIEEKYESLSNQFEELKNCLISILNKYERQIIQITDNKFILIMSGLFEEKPVDVEVGYPYFCTDKQTTEGSTDGIMIYHKGDNVWVDALGRIIE